MMQAKQEGYYEQAGAELGRLVDSKNRAYGDAFNKSGDFLRLLYPYGIKTEQYDDMLALVRVFDKQMRIATDRDALGESPWGDLGGYGLLMSCKQDSRDDLKDQGPC